MWWPEDLDKGFNAAQAASLRRMIAEQDDPKPGLAGGISQVRAWRGGKEPFEIASLGTGPEHTGLLKSLREDGSIEGSVLGGSLSRPRGNRNLEFTTLFGGRPQTRTIGDGSRLCAKERFWKRPFEWEKGKTRVRFH